MAELIFPIIIGGGLGVTMAWAQDCISHLVARRRSAAESRREMATAEALLADVLAKAKGDRLPLPPTEWLKVATTPYFRTLGLSVADVIAMRGFRLELAK
jgi:hypothetical protein